MDRTAFEQERLTGVGGSDVQDVLNLAPWGCARRLWYEKRQVAPDYAIPQSNLFTRGQKLEALVAEEYQQATGREIHLIPTMQRHPVHRELLVHIDRAIPSDDPLVRTGILEIKTVGQTQFYKVKREGLPHAYICQIQHAMFVTAANWGAFAVFWPDGWVLRHWDVEADEQLQALIRDECLKFWVQVENGPAPDALTPSDPRCQKCAWRASCQGEALKAACKDAVDGGFDAGLAQLAQEYFELKEMRDDADALFEGVSQRVKDALGNRTSSETVGARIYFRPQTAMRWDTKALDKDYPQLAEKYKKPSVSRPLRVYPI